MVILLMAASVVFFLLGLGSELWSWWDGEHTRAFVIGGFTCWALAVLIPLLIGWRAPQRREP